MAGTFIAGATGAVAGLLTSFGQGVLPNGVGSLANSAGPWVLVAFAVALRTRSPLVGALWATVTLVMCEIGYVVVTELRGFDNNLAYVRLWLVAAVLAGPALGVAAAWTRRSRSWYEAAAGPAVLAGTLVGEGTWALGDVADTTTPAWWIGEIVIGVAIFAANAVHIVRVGARPLLAVPAGIAVAVAAASVVALSASSI